VPCHLNNFTTYHIGSNPVLTAEGVNPETRKEKVDDSLERQAKRSGGGNGRRGISELMLGPYKLQ